MLTLTKYYEQGTKKRQARAGQNGGCLFCRAEKTLSSLQMDGHNRHSFDEDWHRSRKYKSHIETV
jgi:hypothetical protein